MAVGGQSPVFTDIDAGASTVAGSVDIFPAGAASGKIAITCANSAGDTTTTIVNASQSGIRTYTIPDAGGSSTFLMEAGNQDAALKDIDAGASGTAGSLDIFPSTGSKGKVAIVAADNTNDDTLTITNATQAGAYTVTIPNADASSEFVLSEKASIINGVKTFGSMPIFPAATVAAAGNVQGNAAPIALGITLVTGADGTKGVRLPPAVQGGVAIVKNNVTNTLPVFPASGASINALVANAKIDMANVTACMFCCYDGTDWFTLPLLPS